MTVIKAIHRVFDSARISGTKRHDLQVCVHKATVAGPLKVPPIAQSTSVPRPAPPSCPGLLSSGFCCATAATEVEFNSGENAQVTLIVVEVINGRAQDLTLRISCGWE